MIHDATGKFSSRCVLPDRRSLALVINYWPHSLAWRGAMERPRTQGNACPIYGNTPPKPMLGAACCGRPPAAVMRLLPVVFQHLGASRRQMRAVLLQARENHEIALVDELAAVTLDVAVAGRLFLR